MNEIELKKIFKDIDLESPSSGFESNIMKSIVASEKARRNQSYSYSKVLLIPALVLSICIVWMIFGIDIGSTSKITSRLYNIFNSYTYINIMYLLSFVSAIFLIFFSFEELYIKRNNNRKNKII